MTVQSFDVAAPLQFTSSAAEHFRASLASTGKSAVRISVAESGCTGFKYVMDVVAGSEEGDSELELDNGVQVFVAADAIDFLRGTEVDMEQEGINHVLKFRNPNVVAECGCGESFSVA